MTDEQIDRQIAELTNCAGHGNYCNDLNAMHEAEKVLAPRSWNNFSENWWNYSKNLACISDGRSIHATARERAEAFLRTLGKWEQSGDATEMVKEGQK